jgi:hypothetical protein
MPKLREIDRGRDGDSSATMPNDTLSRNQVNNMTSHIHEVENCTNDQLVELCKRRIKKKLRPEFNGLAHAIAHAEELKRDPRELEAVKTKYETALVRAYAELEPDTFALFEHDGQAKMNLAETIKMLRERKDAETQGG